MSLQILQPGVCPTHGHDQFERQLPNLYRFGLQIGNRIYTSSRQAERENLDPKIMDTWTVHWRLQSCSRGSLWDMAGLWVSFKSERLC